MRRSSAFVAMALAALPGSAFAFNEPVPAGPPVVPYLCSEGRPLSVIYESGSDYIHARALVTFDGHTTEMRASPTLFGVRYRTEGGAEGGSPVAWTLNGEEGWLTQSPDADGYTRHEQEVARCIRLRGAAASEHGEAH